MTQPNIVEGDYTGIDYGTIDDTQTQSPFASSGPSEVIFSCLNTLNCFINQCSVFWEMLASRNTIKEVPGLEPHNQERQQLFTIN